MTQSRPPRVIRISLLAVLLAAVLAGGLLPLTLPLTAGTDGAEVYVRNTRLAVPRPVAPFELIRVKDQGQFVRDNLSGQWTLLFSGYSHCPDICPTTLAMLAQVEARLQTHGSAKKSDLSLVFISVDPRRDDPGRLQRYVGHFSGNMIGLSGSHRQIAQALSAVGLGEPQVSPWDVDVIAHSAAIAVIGPDLHLYALVRPPHNVAHIVELLVNLMVNLDGGEPLAAKTT